MVQQRSVEPIGTPYIQHNWGAAVNCSSPHYEAAEGPLRMSG
jgi:hypothetical protein